MDTKITFSAAELKQQLIPHRSNLPELFEFCRHPLQKQYRGAYEKALDVTQKYLADIEAIPLTTYTRYRSFARFGTRPPYEIPLTLKHNRLIAMTLRLIDGKLEYKDPIQDYIWSICEETNWVGPAHERRPIDLFSVETGLLLAETIVLLDDFLDGEVKSRVRSEIERRIFLPYLTWHEHEEWYLAAHNWNGVCNSCIGAMFLWLEPDLDRTCQALEIALRGLSVFVERAFEADGASNEGVGYWHYGLMYYITFAEMLFARTGGAVDLLATSRVKMIADYPFKLWLSGAHFASFSDAQDITQFHPGLLARLVKRSGERSLEAFLGEENQAWGDVRLPIFLRDILWWNGKVPPAPEVDDGALPEVGVARLTVKTPGGSVTAVVKAGHNAENHNHNDVGSFVLHSGGESFLVDPGHGQYSRDYFGPARYENIFTNSYGHSVPRIGGSLQPCGREYSGKIEKLDFVHPDKTLRIQMGSAYAVAGLKRLTRMFTLEHATGNLELVDEFEFAGAGCEVEEAFVTWLEVEVEGPCAILLGKQKALRMTCDIPGSSFSLERLEEQSRTNNKTGVLKRLALAIPPRPLLRCAFKMEWLNHSGA